VRNFADRTFVIFDVETTGLSPKSGDRVIEIAGLKIEGLAVVDQFHSLVNPGRPVSYGAYLVNGISDAMLKGAPSPAEIFPAFTEFIRGACLVGHNVRFDLSFLAAELFLLGRRWEREGLALDTVKMARGLLPDARRCSLQGVAQFLGIEEPQQHRALADVEMTYRVFRRLLEIAERRDITDLAQLLELFGVKASKARKARSEADKFSDERREKRDGMASV